MAPKGVPAPLSLYPLTLDAVVQHVVHESSTHPSTCTVCNPLTTIRDWVRSLGNKPAQGEDSNA
ncbi:hypothetical protein LCGC14_1520640 [marine sediment metagenome]|uniref:Uncharacterized protein n=1 Tax=marine sediment metagenome TaxID=412755 RepID=A0A0F9IYQ2_9ZZZZ